MKSFELRHTFLNYFEELGHTVRPSSSLVPLNDESVLLTTAGMQQFKKYFKDPELATADLGSRRACSVQKCFRTSDIEEVGDLSHLTFFEMLGNFSFGDYFKEDAIKWGWELMTKVLKFDLSRLHVTVFEGDATVPQDSITLESWRQLGLPAHKIKFAGRADNFWGPTGDEGPCGPTTEIYVDGLEVWNIVFNEYYQNKDGSLATLKAPGVDTGMGLERLLLSLNRVNSVFETDLFSSLMALIAAQAKIQVSPAEMLRAQRVIADHLKASTFLISDGVRPSNVKQGYILRRLLRRLIRFEQLLGLDESVAHEGIEQLRALYGKAYPAMSAQGSIAMEVIDKERETFKKALAKGLKEFNNLVALGTKISGLDAFMLFESFGFPFEFTLELAREKGMSLDRSEFDAALEAHRAKSRK